MKNLIIEYKLNDTFQLVFRCIYFAFNKDTGAKYVSDLIDYSVEYPIAELVLHNIDWEDITEVRVVASTHKNTQLANFFVKDTYEAARHLSLILSVCVCDYKNMYDDDGAINDEARGKPCLQAFIDTGFNEGGDFHPYRSHARGEPFYHSSIVEADYGKKCLHGSTYGTCISSQCHVWTDEEIAADC